MVGPRAGPGRAPRILAIFALLLPAAAPLADVTASVDRAEVDFNESFNLTIESDDVLPLQPDITALEQDFDVLGQSQSSSATIVNGQISQTRSWIYALMPKREGELRIPPIRVGSDATEPVTVTVRASVQQDLGGADVIVTAEIDRESTWVQAQVVYTLKILTAVAPRQPRLDEPEISGGEILVQQLGDDTRYETLIDGRTYSVVERRYVLFPQQSGDYEISEARYSARIWERGRLSARKLFRSNKLTLSVAPIPPPPDGFPNAAWLPAEQVLLSERWNPDEHGVAAGEPITRTVKVSAVGLLASQLPELPEPQPEGLRVYPDQPELETTDAANGVVGFRTERFAMIAAKPGNYTVPETRVPWWNVATAEWELASLPAISLSIGDPLQGATGAPQTPAVLPVPENPIGEPGGGNLWRLSSLVLGTGWLLTVAAWLWRNRLPKPRRRLTDSVPGYRVARRLIREARSAAHNNEARQAARRLLEWAEAHWPDDPPASLGELSRRVPEPLAGAIDELHAALYGPRTSAWNGRRLAAALAVLIELPARKSESATDALAPLTP